MFDLLGKVEALTNSVIHWTRPRERTPGATKGRRFWIDAKMTQDERRCVLAHELFHILKGHDGCQPPAVEWQVRLETARFLISFEELKEAVRWSCHPAVIAEELGVTEQILIDRYQTLDGDQMTELWSTREDID